ncbi:uncharacterized protein LOC144172205 [Haemaphysalis longicornis]
MDEGSGVSCKFRQPREIVGEKDVNPDGAIGGDAMVPDEAPRKPTAQFSWSPPSEYGLAEEVLSEPALYLTVPKRWYADDIPALKTTVRSNAIMNTTAATRKLPDMPEVSKQLMAIVGVVKCDRKRCGEGMWSPRGYQYER